MKIIFGLLFLAFTLTNAAVDPKDKEVEAVAADLTKGLKQMNISLSADEQKSVVNGISRLAKFKPEDDPRLQSMIKDLKAKLPGFKEKVFNLANRVDNKVPNITKKVGQGLMKGFTKLGNVKFPEAVAKFKTMMTDIGNKGGKSQQAVTLGVQADKLKACMQKSLINIAKPLGLIVAKAGQLNKNAFRELVKPFTADAVKGSAAKDSGADDDFDLDSFDF